MSRRYRVYEYMPYEETGPLKIRPFEKLASLMAKAKKAPKSLRISENVSKREASKVESDEQLFYKAMKGVTPLEGRIECEPADFAEGHEQNLRAKKEADDLQKGIEELSALVKGQRPLPVEKIPEYIDGPQFNMDRGLVRRLRRGQFAIHAYCELHGLRADEALQVMDGFMSDSIMNNRRAIAFIHGRGRSSQGKPVLKGLVKDFLNRGRFRRYVLAYSSAPAWDGGPGVTYVLIRKRPVKKLKKR